MISVVIPCYNAIGTIAATIDSALSQGVDVEVIVVNDGSTDKSAEVLERFNTRIEVITTPNRGASAARTTGTKAANGEFIQFLDSDDLLAPGTLAARVDALAKVGVDVAHTDWQQFTFDAHGRKILGAIRRNDLRTIEENAEVATATTFWAPPAALLYSREIVERVGGWHPHLSVIQDARFLFDASAAGARFVHVPGVGAHYMVSSSSLSRRSKARFIADCALNAREVEQLWQTRGSLNPAQKRALTEMWGHVAMATLLNGLPEFEGARASFNRHAPRRLSFEVGALARAGLGVARAAAIARAVTAIKRVVKREAPGVRGRQQPALDGGRWQRHDQL